MQKDDVARIAAGLTEAQREACITGRAWYPRCRDCADMDGTCPTFHDWPCDRDERRPYEEAVRNHLTENRDDQ